MKQARSFAYTTRSFDRDSRIASFRYEVTFAGADPLSFTETLQFPADKDMRDLPGPLLDRFLEDLHLVLGVSYWKLYLPPELDLGNIRLSPAQARFWQTLYTVGMGEFHYRNGVDFRSVITFPVTEDHVVDYFELPARDRALMGIGGGKDSIVSGELAKEHDYPFDGFTMESASQTATVDPVARIMGIELVKVTRTLDTQLMSLKNTYTGHVPVSAIYAFTGLLAAVLFDYRYVVVSNEASSSEGNVEYHGIMVNHQWSKSWEFEKLFREYSEAFLVRGTTYFSLLRPYSELKIGEMFTRYPEYFSTFSSCNRNFRVSTDGTKTPMRWCGECAKCAFAFAMLAAYVPKETVVTIFGKDLYADPGLTPVFAELLGVKDSKPFDCVGTPDEVKTAFAMARERGEWDGTPIMQLFVDKVTGPGMNVSLIRHEVFKRGDSSLIPEPFLSMISAL